MQRMTARLGAEEIKRFLIGRPTYAFEPASGKLVACVTYNPDGTCHFEMEDGSEDTGAWGIVADTYWTRYRAFRGGSKNIFHLSWVAPDVAQAFHEDGTPAFLQSGRRELDGGHDDTI